MARPKQKPMGYYRTAIPVCEVVEIMNWVYFDLDRGMHIYEGRILSGKLLCFWDSDLLEELTTEMAVIAAAGDIHA